MSGLPTLHGTTILAVRHGGVLAMAGDGQVTLGQETILKAKASKLRRLYGGKVVIGFAGSTSDALTLGERFEKKLEEHSGHLRRAAVELSKDWRTDRLLRRLEALLIVADSNETLLLTGAGDVISPDDGILGIGSGGNYAMSAARALARHAPAMTARDICTESMRIAAELCVFTNENLQVECLP